MDKVFRQWMEWGIVGIQKVALKTTDLDILYEINLVTYSNSDRRTSATTNAAKTMKMAEVRPKTTLQE